MNIIGSHSQNTFLYFQQFRETSLPFVAAAGTPQLAFMTARNAARAAAAAWAAGAAAAAATMLPPGHLYLFSAGHSCNSRQHAIIRPFYLFAE